MNTGEKIRALRIECGMTQTELGEKVGVKFAAINKYETGVVTNLKRSTIKKLADALGTTPAYLMGWDEAPECPHEAAQACEYYELCHASAVTAEAAGLFSRLDTLDQGKALGRMEDMLEGDKYKASGEGKKYKEFVSEDGEKILLSEKAM